MASSQHYNQFHNLSNEALADAIGQTDALLKGVEAEVAALKANSKSAAFSPPPASASPSRGRTKSAAVSTSLP